MDELSGIDPRRWAEVRRRAAVVRDYLQKNQRDAASAKLAAGRLDLSVSQFAVLTRAFEIHRNHASLAGAGAQEVKTRQRPDGIDPRAEEHLASAVERHGCSASLKTIADQVVHDCEQEGVPFPSKMTINDKLMGFRSSGKGHRYSGPPTIIVSRLWLDFPVVGSEGFLTFTEALLAVHLPERSIACHEVGTMDNAPPSLIALLSTLDADVTDTEPTRSIVVHRREVAGLNMTNDAIRERLEIGDDASALVARYLGDQLDTIGLRFRRPRVDPAKLLRSRFDSAVDPADALTALEMAIHNHNQNAFPAALLSE
ncbi:hypothetical protein MTsPCn7_26500 [Altererythrobacter sp. MTPC7]